MPQPDELFVVFGLILFSFSGGLVILFGIRKKKKRNKQTDISTDNYERWIKKYIRKI